MNIGALLGIVQGIAANPMVQGIARQAFASIDAKLVDALSKSGHIKLAGIAANKDFQTAAISTFAGIGAKINAALAGGDRLTLASLGAELTTNAPAMLGAIVVGTHAEKLVAPEVIAATQKTIDRETTQFG